MRHVRVQKIYVAITCSPALRGEREARRPIPPDGRGTDVSPGRQDVGGIHLYGLCAKCNGKASKFDGAYGEFARAMDPLWFKRWQIHLPPLITTLPVEFDPGSVVRSILGMCATGPLIKRHWAELPLQLATGEPVEMPSEIRLYLALARGLTARVAGPILGYHAAGPNHRKDSLGVPVGRGAVASVYFPPLAWELVLGTIESTLPDEGWADVSSWTEIRAGDTHSFSDLVAALPAVCHPKHHPTRHQHWLDLVDTEAAPIVQCANVKGGPPDPLVPVLAAGKYASTDELASCAAPRSMTHPIYLPW